MLAFDWDEDNRNHIARQWRLHAGGGRGAHWYTKELDFYVVRDEERIEEVGTTLAGRILFLVITIRNDSVRVVTSYDATASLSRHFWNFKGQFMNEKKQLPNFATEKEEADWWFSNREALGKEFAQAIRDGQATENTLTARLARIQLDPADVDLARAQAKTYGIGYQTYVKMLVHEALQRRAPTHLSK